LVRSAAEGAPMGQDESDGYRPDREQLNAFLRAISTVKTVILCVCMVIWAVLGFLFWIPMLCYAIARFSALVLYTTIINANPDKLAIHLEHAVRFYFVGFRNILRAIYAKPQSHTEDSLGFTINWAVVLVHTLGIVVFWAVIVVTGLWIGGVFRQ
jgi:hypothetical protein